MAATQAVLTPNTAEGEVQGTREVMIIQTLYSLDHLVGCYTQYSMSIYCHLPSAARVIIPRL